MRRSRWLASLALAAVLGLASSPTAIAAAPWWEPVGLRGAAVDALVVRPGILAVHANGRWLVSHDGGRSFRSGPAPAPKPCAPGLVPAPSAEACAGDTVWAIVEGHVVVGRRGEALHPDPRAPDLGPGAHLVAAPAALPGRVVAVAEDGTVWRRAEDGRWGRALLLLPQSLLAGPPRVTAVTAFPVPVSAAIYLATDGYGVLLSLDGGDDWVRADPDLPGRVLALVADATGTVVYAGTADGLWRHELRAFPRPPDYPAPDLRWRWVVTAMVTVAAWGLGAGLLRRFSAVLGG